MILLMVLVCLLGAAVLGFCGLGLLQHLRTAALARRANESGLHFSAEDAFDVPRRCAAFAICSAGHSPQASNVTYGRLRGLPVRAFDFRYEVGHGTRRSTRYYCVVLLEVPGPRAVLLWNRRDGAGAPPAARVPEGTCRDWSYRGDGAQARRLAEVCESLAGSGVSVEARAEGVMLCFPVRRRGATYAPWLELAPGLIGSLDLSASPAAGAEKGAPDAVANRPPPC